MKLKWLDLDRAQITDAGCATLAAAFDSGALPGLDRLFLQAIPGSLLAPRRRPPCMRRAPT